MKNANCGPTEREERFGFGGRSPKIWWIDATKLTLHLTDHPFGDYYAPLSCMLTTKDRAKWVCHIKQRVPTFSPNGFRLALETLFTKEVVARLESGLDWKRVLRGRIAEMGAEIEKEA
jgi:hypothetical protein